MATSQPGMSDAGFFSLVHHVLHANRSSDANSAWSGHGDRQRQARLQYVAPYVEGRLPGSADFMQVRCHDLSLGGFSFLSDYPPDYEQVIVALGSSPPILMSARVAHHSPTTVDGQACHLVGCQFIARIESAIALLLAPAVTSDVSRTAGVGSR